MIKHIEQALGFELYEWQRLYIITARLICYYDGRSGGTAQTVHMAEQSGLKIVNLADGQLSLL